jgi:hypothetical protein
MSVTTEPPMGMTAPTKLRPPVTAPPPKPVPLGEELPVFCEKCGYSLHGLPHMRCEHCTVLQFHCPECGHHQAINTLRPAFQAMLGRIRAGWLTGAVIFKIAFFGLMLFAWAAMGNGWSYTYDWESVRAAQQQQAAQYQQTMAQYQALQAKNPNANIPPPVFPQMNVRPSIAPAIRITTEARVAFILLGAAFGMVSRMLLLRWRRGFAVGWVLAGLVLIAMWVGVAIRRADIQQGDEYVPWPTVAGFIEMNLWAVACIVAGASVVWGIWTLLVHAFLPARIAKALLDWQTSLSNRASTLAR